MMSVVSPPPTTPLPSRLWTAREAADWLVVSRSWVYLHMDNGDLPFFRIGGLRRLSPADVMAYAERQKFHRGSAPLLGKLERKEPKKAPKTEE